MPRGLEIKYTLEEIRPRLGLDYAVWLLKSRRTTTTLTLKRKVLDHLAILAIEASKRRNQTVWRNEVFENLVAWVFSDPERVEDFLTWAFGPAEEQEVQGNRGEEGGDPRAPQSTEVMSSDPRQY